MKPDPRFLKQPKQSWANVRLVSEKYGYTARGTGRIKVPSVGDLTATLTGISPHAEHLVRNTDQATFMGRLLLDYFPYRAERRHRC